MQKHIGNTKRKMAKEEDFPISRELIEQFVAANSGKWETTEKKQKNIYINFSMVRLQIPWIMPKIIYALGVSEAGGYRIKAITWRKNALLDRFLDSVNVEHIVLEEIDRKNILAALKAFFITITHLVFDGTPEGLKRFQIGTVPVGYSIYEDILRTSSLSTIRSTRNWVCSKKIFHLMWMLLSMKEYLRRYPPALCVADDLAYHEEALLGLFRERGSVIYNVSAKNEETISFNKSNRIIRRGESQNRFYHDKIKLLGDDVLSEAEVLLNKRFQGENGRDIDRGAFAKKAVMDRNDLNKELNLDPKKKNIVIMAHTFTDAIYNYGDIYFRDYYDWLEQTLKIAREVKTVNWILKPHPTRKAYHESEDSIEKMFERFSGENMRMISDRISTETIKKFADVIVTIGGSAGGEFSCFGIPSVIVGKPYYSGFGYTVEPKTRQEYEETLKKIENMKPLTPDQINTAKKVFYIKNGDNWSDRQFRDDFSELLQKKYGKMQNEIALQYFENNKGTKEYNDSALKSVIEYLQSNDIRKCEYYQRGKSRIKNV